MVKPRSLLQQIATWVGMLLLGIPITILFGALLGRLLDRPPTQAAGFVYGGWVIFCLVMQGVANWVGGRALILWFVSILPGIALIFVIAPSFSSSWYAPVTFFGLIGIWALLTSILSRNEKLMYLGLHVVNWCLAAGFFVMGPPHDIIGFTALLIPVAISLILFGCYQPMTQLIASTPLTRRQPVQPQPKPATDQYQAPYGEGYRPGAQYTEGNQVYTYQPQPEQAQTQYPQQMQ